MPCVFLSFLHEKMSHVKFVRYRMTLQYAIVSQNNVKMAHKKYLG